MRTLSLLALTLFSLTALKAQKPFTIEWENQTIDKPISMRAISAVSSLIAWAGGSNGTWLRTINGGKTWEYGTIPGAAKLDLRGVVGFTAHTAYFMSSGTPAKVFRTTDGGAHWNEQYTHSDPAVFLDAIAFWDEKNGIIVGDPIQEKFFFLRTSDGGKNWKEIKTDSPALSLQGEACFAASGTCLRVFGKSSVYFVTGSGKQARIFRSNDKGKSWKWNNTPIAAGSPSKGIFSFHFSDMLHGIAVGGDYKNENDSSNNIAITEDGGYTWKPIVLNPPSGFRECIDYIDASRWITMGPTGCDISYDKGLTWQKAYLDTREKFGIHSFALSPEKNIGWAVGEKGKILKFTIVL